MQGASSIRSMNETPQSALPTAPLIGEPILPPLSGEVPPQGGGEVLPHPWVPWSTGQLPWLTSFRFFPQLTALPSSGSLLPVGFSNPFIHALLWTCACSGCGTSVDVVYLLWISKSVFVEVNHFEKKNKDSILHFNCNQRFGRVMAFLCPMDVSVVWLPSDAIWESYSRDRLHELLLFIAAVWLKRHIDLVR